MDYAVGILMKKKPAVSNLFSFLNPFHNTVWYSIIAGLVVVSGKIENLQYYKWHCIRFLAPWFSSTSGKKYSIQKVLLYVLNRVSPKRIRGPKYHDTSLHGIFWFVYSSLVQQSTGAVIIQ